MMYLGDGNKMAHNLNIHEILMIKPQSLLSEKHGSRLGLLTTVEPGSITHARTHTHTDINSEQ